MTVVPVVAACGASTTRMIFKKKGQKLVRFVENPYLCSAKNKTGYAKEQ